MGYGQDNFREVLRLQAVATSATKESVRLGVQNNSEVDREVVFGLFNLLPIEKALNLFSKQLGIPIDPVNNTEIRIPVKTLDAIQGFVVLGVKCTLLGILRSF